MDQKLLAIRKRLKDDFPYFTAHALKIRTKDGEIAPLVLNEPQCRLMEAVEQQWATYGRLRVIVLKARQQGLSTAIGAWLYWYAIHHVAQRCIVATHHGKSTDALFQMTKRYFNNTPAILKPSTQYNSKREIFFDKLDTSYLVGTAGSEGIGRGETISLAHLSELAFWQPSSARENFNGLMQAIPQKPGTAVFIESTANGVSGLFYELWQGAVKGENDFIPVFLPWYITDEYRSPAPADFRRSPLEIKLVADYGLDNDQLQFRRLKVAESGADTFRQEYPSNADEAFLTTGRPVFNLEQLHGILEGIKDNEPLYKMALSPNGKWRKDDRGELAIYRKYDANEQYTIGADTSAGIRGRDFSVAQVLDRRKRQVATLRGHFQPDYFADLLYALGDKYNNALIAPESNNHGILTVNRLYKDLNYPYVYQSVVVDKVTDEETITLGFQTNKKTKPLIIDQLRASIRDGEITLNDPNTVRELQTYVVNEDGSMSAETSYFDDTVMSLAIANYVHEGVFDPIINQEEWYSSGL